MKIAMIGHKRIPGREGGVEVVVEELAIRMAKNNDVTAYNRKKKNIQKNKSYKGVNIITIPTIESKSLDALVYSFFATIHALFKKYDIYHYHAIGPSVMSIIPHLFGKKIVVTVHGLNYKTPKWKGFGEKYLKLGEKIVAKYANEIIVLSREQQQYFKEKYNRDTIYIPNGVTVDNSLEPNIIKEKWGLNKNKYILFLSRMVPGKGLEYLIKAYKDIDTDIPLVIAGGSEYVSEFYKMICDMVSDDKRIKMIGFVNGEVLNELYSNALLYVFPSEAEGMPMCLLEALSLDCKCLVSDIPENIEVGKEYVQFFKSGDVEDLKGKLKLCIENDNVELFKSSRKYIQDHYNWDLTTEKTLEIYDKVRRK